MSESVSRKAASAPRIGIVVPVFNAVDTLPACLYALPGQTIAPPRFHVVFVDNGSTDGSQAWIEKHAAELNESGETWVHLISESRRGPSAARNAGVRFLPAETKILVFLDADCSPEHDWLEQLLSELLTAEEASQLGVDLAEPSRFLLQGPHPHVTGADAAGGVMRMRRYMHDLPLIEAFSEHEKILNVHEFFVDRPEKPPFVATANMTVRREMFEKLGGFDETLSVGEDADFCWRLQQAGGTLRLALDARVEHRHRTSFWKFVRQMYSYGFGSVVVFGRHRSRFRRRVFIDWMIYLNILRAMAKTVIFPFTKREMFVKLIGPLELVRHLSFLTGRITAAVRHRIPMI